MEKIERHQVFALKEMGYGEGSYAIDSMHKREMAVRTKDLRLIGKDRIDSIAEMVGAKVVDLSIDSASEWAVVMEPIKRLKIYFILQRYSPEFDDEMTVLYGREVKEIGIPIDDLYDFTRLCANALVRAAKTIMQPP